MADDKIAKAGTTTLEPPPDYVGQGREGLETITQQDMLLPRLALAQAQSPQVTEGDPAFNPDLKPGDLFNSLTGQKYGREVYVQILRKDPPRGIEWRPIEEGGGIIDPDVPLDDPRMKFGPDGEKPRAMLYRDYIAVVLPGREVISLSFKSTGIKVAKQLNGLIALRGRPMFAGRYKITTDVSLKPQPHKVYKVANAGWVGKEDYEAGERDFHSVRDLVVRVDREARPDDIPFDVPAGGAGGDVSM